MSSDHAPRVTQPDRAVAPEPVALAGILSPLLDALDHATAAEVARDPFRRDPRFIRRQLPVLRAIAEYFDVEIRGWRLAVGLLEAGVLSYVRVIAALPG